MSSKKKSVSRKRLYGVLLPVGAGKTKLSNFVHGKKGKKNVIFIDVDTNLKIDRGRNSIEYFPKIKLMIEKTYRTYSKYKIVVVSSNQQLLGFLKIPAKNVFTYVPEVYFFLKMLTVRKLLNPPFADTELGEELETEVEQKAKQHKTEDALSATRAAAEEGIVPGGGVALLRSLSVLNELKVEGDEKTGVNILRRAIEEPIRQIAQNAGMDGAVVAEGVKKKEGGSGFNAQTMEYQDLMQVGIVDPTKVVRSALENAASAASMFLTTEAVVCDIPEEKKGKGGIPSMPEEY